MAEFLSAIAIFALAHTVPPIPSVRNRLIELVGFRVYIIAYSLLSLALIVWVIAAARAAPYWPLWTWQPWQAVIPLVVMPLAMWLIIAGLTCPNPLSISLRSREASRAGFVVAVTRHPVLWGFLLWSASHIPANGDLVSLVLFGSLSIFATFGLYALDLRERRRLGQQAWRQLARTTSMVPFVALIERRTSLALSKSLAISLVATAAIYLWFVLQGHSLLIGINPLTGL